MIVNGFNSDISALRELIFCGAVGISGAINYAHKLFAEITEPDTFIYNTMIRGSAQSRTRLNSIILYTQMENNSVKPDKYTFSFVLKACTKLLYRNTGFCVHGKVIKHGFEFNKFARNTLIYFHANCGDLGIARVLFDGQAKGDVVAWSALTAGYARRGELSVARSLFDEMPVKDLVSWNVMITAYVKQGEMENAQELFNNVPKRDVVTWNAMIAGYVLSGMNESALEMFEEMRSAGERPDEVTMLSLLSACRDLKDLETGKKVHLGILEMKSGFLNVLLGNALIDMYAKCGEIEKAMEVFNGVKDKDISTWNSLIVGLAFHGHAEETIKLFNEMRSLRVTPNEITFVGVIIACSHAGKVEEGWRYFNLMKDVYNIDPNIKHYGCMVDLLGRSGLLNEAIEFIDKMEIKPNAIIWRTLLGACRIHGNVNLGRRANERLLNMRRDESGDYVLLSNIYASQGEWVGVEKLRKLMDDSGIRKEAGHSLVDADDEALMHFLLDVNSTKLSLKNSSASSADK